MTITQTFVKLQTPQTNNFPTPVMGSLGGNSYEVDHENGHIPAMTIDYPTGEKILIVITGLANADFGFVSKMLNFNIEQYNWNSIFNKWDRTDSGKFTGSKLSITNSFQVRGSDGKWKEELTEQELYDLNNPSGTDKLVGEYDFWSENLAKQIIFPNVLTATAKKFQQQ